MQNIVDAVHVMLITCTHLLARNYVLKLPHSCQLIGHLYVQALPVKFREYIIIILAPFLDLKRCSN